MDLKTHLSQSPHPLPESAYEQLHAYITLLLKWNKAINLTAVTTFDQVVSHHIVDSLSILPYVLEVQTLCDVGSGAGLPGIPLAIARPEMSVTLLECSQKRCHFLNQAIRHCGLKNVQVVCSRVEDYQPTQGFEAVVTRAYASLSEMLQQTAHLCDNKGRFLAMKGNVLPAESQSVPKSFVLKAQVDLTVANFLHRSLWIYAHATP